MRAFLAIWLPDEIREALAALQGVLASVRADVKWVEIENLHVTLKFLGEINDESLPAVTHLLEEVGRSHAPFTMRLDAVGAFPSMDAPRVVWVGVGEGREPVTSLARALEDGLGRLGLRREERPFAAHVTLGRLRSNRRRWMLTKRLRDAPWSAPRAWRVDAVRLYRSVLDGAGPRYAALADAPLVG